MKGAGRTLTVAEGAAMICGIGIGSGVMAIPCLIKSAGVIGGLLAFAAAFALSAVMHCLTADMVINSGEHEIPRIFSCLLPPGKRNISGVCPVASRTISHASWKSSRNASTDE